MVMTLKKMLSKSCASMPVQVAITPNGNVNPHQPMLNGNFCIVTMLMRAKDNYTSAKPHIMSARKMPRK
ncbi:hypothetical protein CKAH01_05057 [Colletotrichum kahawae]|uniref:Uncharacterized protein n=1 Tax=Colletotrichum kahawae TaxID=34407 RepID=A0AAE0D9I6_COLKA|nr:hypothetical protein CKAH01_05057 [Colletotrichum kahawae]